MTEPASLAILVVDDRPESRLATGAVLESLGERVVLAESGEEALRCLLSSEFALILLDVQMPEMDGFETARMIKAWPKTRNVPLIFTGATEEAGHFEARGYALGAVDYMPAPFDPVKLRAKAAVFLDLARQNARLREQAEALARSVRYKDEFLDIVSHELKTPISGVIGFTELLADDLGPGLGPVQKGYLAEIAAATDRLRSLVDDLLDMGRIQAGRFTLCPMPTDFAGVLDAAVRSVESAARCKQLRLATAIAPALPELVIDPERVRKVLVHLLNNAVKFTPPGGSIRVAARLDGDAVRCEIADDGPGIPPGDQRRIFERFGQVDTASTREAGGAGLGLSISKAIVEGHGGAIGVESRPGRGSTFWFSLPAPQASREEVGEPGIVTRPAAGTQTTSGRLE